MEMKPSLYKHYKKKAMKQLGGISWNKWSLMWLALEKQQLF